MNLFKVRANVRSHVIKLALKGQNILAMGKAHRRRIRSRLKPWKGVIIILKYY